MALLLRGSTYHLRKRVPLRYRPVEVREHVAVSLHTDSQRLAVRKADEIWAQLIDGWEMALRGDKGGAQARYEAAKHIAAQRGFSFIPAPALANASLEDIVKRALAVPANRDGSANQRIGDALLGGVKEPAIQIEKALEVFWEQAADRERGKSPDQIRKWRNPKTKALKNLVSQIGNKEISAISRADMVKFRDWWRDRLKAENLVANSANKDLIHIGHVLRTANARLGLGLEDHLDKILKGHSFKDDRGDERDRPPFSDGWIREVLLKDGALDGLNIEARCILVGMVNTGARPSEIAGLLPDHIRLETAVPHISIEPVGRQLKNPQSKRVIPLTGISLKAFQDCPNGFPTYRGKDTASATINKFMRENGLMESDQHVLYSLRHAFEDRMIAGEFDDRMRRQLFGHKLNREKYGKGPSLELMHEKLKAIAI
jgi:integrase